MEKKFKAFEKVIIKSRIDECWSCDLYSHLDKDTGMHETINRAGLKDNDILPYEGNEHLVGRVDEPDEEVRLEEGELIFVDDTIYDDIVLWNFTRFAQVYSSDSFETKFGNIFKFAIRFKDFDPSNMEETKKHILAVKNGKIVRYKN